MAPSPTRGGAACSPAASSTGPTGNSLARAPTLAAYGNRHITVEVPDDDEVAFLDDDWTLNER
ncbi:MAG: hypothetical protein ACYTG2_11375 [Planctomycetota bacterium]